MTLPFPDGPDALPVEIRRYLTACLLERSLDHHGGWYGLMAWLYKGQHRDSGERIPWTASVAEVWPHIVADAEVWARRRQEASREGTTGA